MQFICFNGRYLPASIPVISIQNPSYKWGEGLFETLKMVQERVLFWEAHCQRLFSGARLLGIDCAHLSEAALLEEVRQLCERNGCSGLARVRLHVCRNEVDEAVYTIEAGKLPETTRRFDPKGDRIAIYPHARKSIDGFSNLKTANYLAYAQAARWARQQGLGDALLLNSENHLCDSSRANLFLVRKGEVFTPHLSQGPVAGVVRNWLIDGLKAEGYVVHQQALREEHLADADEAFLTNSIQDLRPVASFGERTYSCATSTALHERFFATFYR